MDNLFFGLDQPANEDGLVLLRTFHDDVSVTMAEEVLRDIGIPFVKKDRGTGSAMRLITGYSMFGTDLLVAPEDLEQAAELMEALFDVEEIVEGEEEQ